MKTEYLILNDEMKHLVNDIVDDLEEVSKYLDECEGMVDMIDKTKETLKKLDRVNPIGSDLFVPTPNYT